MFVDSFKKNYRFVLSTIATVAAIYVLGQVASTVLLLALKGGNIEAQLTSGEVLLVYLSMATVVLACVYYVLVSSKKGYKSVFKRLGLAKPNWQTVGYSFLGIGTYFICFLIAVTIIIGLGIVDFDQVQDIGFKRDSRGIDLVYAFIALVIIAPVAEEVLFRGFLHRRLKALTNFWFAAIVSSALFALAHWQLNVAIDVFVLSMVIVYVLEVHDNLAVAIAIHALKNLMAFVLAFFLAG